MNEWLADWLTDRLTDLPTYRLTDWPTQDSGLSLGLTHWPTHEWPTDCFLPGLSQWEDENILATVLAESQKEYLEQLRQNVKDSNSEDESRS